MPAPTMSATGHRRIRAAGWIGVVLFVACAALQYNDPDPIRWVILYGAAAIACGFATRQRANWLLPASVGLAALGWAAMYLPAVGGMAFGHLFETMKAGTPAIEESREVLGLLIVAGWMAILTVGALRRHDAAR